MVPKINMKISYLKNYLRCIVNQQRLKEFNNFHQKRI